MAKRNNRQPKDPTMSQTVSDATNQPLPPGAQENIPMEEYPVDAASEDELEVAYYPEEMMDKQAVKKQATRAVKLEQHEFNTLSKLMEAIGDGAWDDPVPYANIPSDSRSLLRYLDSRGIIKLETDEDDGGRILSVRFTERGYVSFSEPTIKAAAKPSPRKASPRKERAERTEPTGRKGAGRGDLSNPDYRVHIVAPTNPRREGTHGYEAFKLYREGMTYDEYLDATYDPDAPTTAKVPFTGPQNNHFTWDLMHGFIAMYDATKSPDDPEYWVMGSKPRSSVINRSAPAMKAPFKIVKPSAAETLANAKAEMAKLEEAAALEAEQNLPEETEEQYIERLEAEAATTPEQMATGAEAEQVTEQTDQPIRAPGAR